MTPSVASSLEASHWDDPVRGDAGSDRCPSESYEERTSGTHRIDAAETWTAGCGGGCSRAGVRPRDVICRTQTSAPLRASGSDATASVRAHPAGEGVEAVVSAQKVPYQPGGGFRAAGREDRIAQPPGRRR